MQMRELVILDYVSDESVGKPKRVTAQDVLSWCDDIGIEREEIAALLARATADDEDGEDARDTLASIFGECEFMLI